MFALAIWDHAERRLFLARDRLGIKPLYVCRLADGLLFGSELKSLLAHPDCPRELDWSGLFTPAPQHLPRVPSYVGGIDHLPGGHYLVAARGKVETHRWWRIDDYLGAAPFGKDLLAYRSEFERLVEEATDEHLLGDVPIGLHLSGGIDSSLLAAIASRKVGDLACFSVVDQNTWSVGDVANARKVTGELGLPWHPVLFDRRTLLDEIHFDLTRFEQSVYMMDSPRFDLEWIFKEELHRFARRQHPLMKVVLLGQGLDEFAGGYSRRLGRLNDNWAAYIAGEIEADLRYWDGVAGGMPERLLELASGSSENSNWSPYQRQMRAYVHQLQHFNLWHEDRSSSSQSLEARVPFLDHRIVELLASVPAELHAHLFWNKRIVRDALGKRLSEYNLEHPKVPFFVTGDERSINLLVHEMLRRCVPAFLDKYLDDPYLPFAAKPLRDLASRVLAREANFYADGWRLAECMAIAVFARQCHAPDVDKFRAVRERKEGVASISESRWPELASLLSEQRFSAEVRWMPSDRLALSPGTRVMAPLNREGAYALVNGRDVHSSIEVPKEMDWVSSMLRHLESEQAADFSLQDWADEFDVGKETLRNVLDVLYAAGFVVRLPVTASEAS